MNFHRLMKCWKVLLAMGASVSVVLAQEEPVPVPVPVPDTDVELIVREAVDRALRDRPTDSNTPDRGAVRPGETNGPGPGSTSAPPPAAAVIAPSAAPVSPPSTVSPQPGAGSGNTKGGSYGFSRDRTSRDTTGRTSPGSRDDRAARLAIVRTVPPALAMPKEMSLALTRSIFIHGRQYTPLETDVVVRPPPVEIYTVPPPPYLARPEKTLLFNGVVGPDGKFTALIEDTMGLKVIALKVGDPVARGKIAALTLYTLDYESGGKIKQIHLGENFDGESIAPSSTRPSTVGGTPSEASGGGALSDVLEKMRQKRLQGK